MNRIRAGIIGCGGIAEYIHFKTLASLDEVEVAALCDIRAERLAHARELFPSATTWANYLEMVRNGRLGCVLVLTPPDSLFRIAVDCLEAGYPVFMEKPAGITVFQADSLRAASERTGRLLQVGFNRRYIPLVRATIKKVRAVTEITQVAGCFFKHDTASFYGGCADAFTCDTIHAIDLMRLLAGADRAVAAATVAMSTGGEGIDDAWNSVMRFDNGVTGVLTANYKTGGRVHSFEMHGPGASAYINLGFGGAACDARIIYRTGGMYSLSASGNADSASGDYEYIDGAAAAGSAQYHDYYGYRDELLAFFEGVRGGATPDSLIADAAQSMRLMQFLRDSGI